jgi:hypothetical protein
LQKFSLMAPSVYAADFFYELTQLPGSRYELTTGVNLASEVLIGEGSVNDSFDAFEAVSFSYTDPVGDLPADAIFIGTYNDDPRYLVFRNFVTGKIYLATNSEVVEPASASVTTESVPICFLAGTRIAVPGGEIAVEDLRIGDAVVTESGIRRLKFLGHTTSWISTLRATGRMPIRIAAGAFGAQGPHQDLWLSPSHAVLLGDHLVEAGALCNGGSVAQVESLDQLQVTYYNLEFDNHDIIQANGLAIESYYANWRSTGLSRSDWDNYADYVALYGEGGPMRELDLPRIPFARQLPAAVRELIGAQPLLAV